jgi:hypothetical protein
MKDWHQEIQVRNAISAADRTATVVGAIIDRKGYDTVTLAVVTGTVTTADGSNRFDALLEVGDAANLSDAAVAPAADVQGAIPSLNNAAFDDKFLGKMTYRGNKRYVRLTMTETGTAQAAFAAVALLGNAGRAPASDAIFP